MQNILKPYNSKAILKNLKQVIEQENIELLSKSAYNFLYLMSGFIAHYDLGGFQYNYRNVDDLIEDISRSADYKDPDRGIRDPFFKNSYGDAYPESKCEILRGLHDILAPYNR